MTESLKRVAGAVEPLPAGARLTRTGSAVEGPGGVWLPAAFKVGPRQWQGAMLQGGRIGAEWVALGVVWACPATALCAAEKSAGLAAGC